MHVYTELTLLLSLFAHIVPERVLVFTTAKTDAWCLLIHADAFFSQVKLMSVTALRSGRSASEQ